jgi:hypothetical protein
VIKNILPESGKISRHSNPNSLMGYYVGLARKGDTQEKSGGQGAFLSGNLHGNGSDKEAFKMARRAFWKSFCGVQGRFLLKRAPGRRRQKKGGRVFYQKAQQLKSKNPGQRGLKLV